MTISLSKEEMMKNQNWLFKLWKQTKEVFKELDLKVQRDKEIFRQSEDYR